MPTKTSNSKSAWSAKDVYDMIFSTYGNAHVNANKARAKEASKYMIPYIPEKEIMLTTGRYNTGKISTNLLDSIYDASQRTGVPLDIALGLAGRESTLGIGRGFKKGKSISSTDLYSNWQQIQTIPNNKAQMKRWNSLLGRTDLTDEDYDFKSEFLIKAQNALESTKPLTEHPIDNALKFYQTGKYNPGDSRHTQMVEEDAKILMSDPAIQEWLKTKNNGQMKYGGRKKAEIGTEKKDKTNVVPIHREQIFIPASGPVKVLQEFRKRNPRGGNLEIVSPEFDLLTGIRGINSLFNNVIGRKLPSNYAYRRAGRQELDDIISTKSFRKIPDNVEIEGGKTITLPNGKTVTFKKAKGNSHKGKAFAAGEPWKGTTSSGNKNSEIIIGVPGNNAKWKVGHHGSYTEPMEFNKISKGEGLFVPFDDNGVADISIKGLKEFTPTRFKNRYISKDIEMKCGGRRKAQLGLDIREGGVAIPIAPNMYYMDGRSHDNGGIAIGPNNKNGLEVEGGEVVKVGDRDIKVFSNVPLLRGVSPAQLVMGGANPNAVFKAQEEFKDRNRINDDGTRYQTGGQKKSNSAIRTEADKKVPAYNRAVYSLVDPTMAYPTKKEAFGYAIGAGIKAMRNPNDMVYWVTDSVSDAAWRKRHGLSYDNKFLIPNEDGSVRLPKDREMEIPTDTTMLKNRIAANKKLAKRYPEGSEKRDIVDWALKVDGMALDSLRHTYRTGEPVTINEGAYNSRRLINNGELSYPEIMPHNVMQNYAIQYDKSKDKMNYWDTYNFNQFEWGVPGKPFEIKGSIPLKRFGGSKQDDTKTAALKHLRNKFTIRGDYNGGMFGGAGAGSVIMAQPEFITDTITKRYLVPVTQNFNDAFRNARNSGQNEFMFNGKLYNTNLGDNPNNNSAGANRTSTIIIPIEHKEVRRRKKEFGGNMIYTINGNVKNSLMSARPKAEWGKGKDEKKTKNSNIRYLWTPEGLIFENGQSALKLNGEAILNHEAEFINEAIKHQANKRPQYYAEKRLPIAGSQSIAEKVGLARSGWSYGENPTFDYAPNINLTVPENYSKGVASSTARGRGTKASTPKATTKVADVKYGTPLKEKKESLYITGIKNNSITPLRAGMEKIKSPSSTGGGTQSKDGRWIGQYKTTNVGDWIGLGSNLAGTIASYFMTKNAINKMPEPIKPVMAQAAKLKTRYNVEPQLSEIREAEQMNRAVVRRNTQSSNTSLAREQRLLNEARSARNTLYGQKENIETQLINQDRLNRQSVMRDNVRAYNEYLNKVTATKIAQNEMRVSNINNLISGLTGSVNSILGNIESRRATNNTLRAIAAANPNVDARLIGGFDYYIDPITKKKYNKNQQYVGTING